MFYKNIKISYNSKASLKNPKQHNDLLLALMEVSFATMNGVKNPQYPPALLKEFPVTEETPAGGQPTIEFKLQLLLQGQ
jgi:hypothetical protein